MLLVSLAGVGHSQIEEGAAGAVHVVSDAAHLLAAGAWLGGLVPLVTFYCCAIERGEDPHRAAI